MIIKFFFIGGAIITGLVCAGLLLVTLLYVAYGVWVDHLQKRRV
jgi:hypothetical protein